MAAAPAGTVSSALCLSFCLVRLNCTDLYVFTVFSLLFASYQDKKNIFLHAFAIVLLLLLLLLLVRV
jgi:hypothetical protein